MKILKYVGFGILGLGFVAGAVFVTMSLWNWLVPELFNGPEIGYWQTAGLFILSKILFAGISPKHHHPSKTDNVWRRKYLEKCREKETATE
ncbi:MAG: ACBP60 family protein [Bacteroidales bacterium]|nr:ACBP60 family protein [Bacteroidales bacterium]MCF8391788.1 ACBP60 family protein [Bacteroidales bacterium]